MRVAVYEVESAGGDPTLLASGVTLPSCFPYYPHDPEYETARDQLQQVGDVAFVGGGASQLFKIMRIG